MKRVPDFSEVLRELDLLPGPDTAAQWQAFADAQGIRLPTEFQMALALGADSLLTQFSNDEVMQIPETVFAWEKGSVLPLLWENQGNFLFGLNLSDQHPAYVLIANEFTERSNPQPAQWQPFAPNFTTFAFVRLLDFQYLFNEATENGEWFFDDLPFTAEIEARLSASFKRGPTTPDPYSSGNAVRYRFYREGQRISVSVEGGRGYWEISAASAELFEQLYVEVRGGV